MIKCIIIGSGSGKAYSNKLLNILVDLAVAQILTLVVLIWIFCDVFITGLKQIFLAFPSNNYNWSKTMWSEEIKEIDEIPANFLGFVVSFEMFFQLSFISCAVWTQVTSISQNIKNTEIRIRILIKYDYSMRK